MAIHSLNSLEMLLLASAFCSALPHGALTERGIDDDGGRCGSGHRAVEVGEESCGRSSGSVVAKRKKQNKKETKIHSTKAEGEVTSLWRYSQFRVIRVGEFGLNPCSLSQFRNFLLGTLVLLVAFNRGMH